MTWDLAKAWGLIAGVPAAVWGAMKLHVWAASEKARAATERAEKAEALAKELQARLASTEDRLARSEGPPDLDALDLTLLKTLAINQPMLTSQLISATGGADAIIVDGRLDRLTKLDLVAKVPGWNSMAWTATPSGNAILVRREIMRLPVTG